MYGSKGRAWQQCHVLTRLKAHIGADVDSGLVHTVVTTPANEADVEVVDELLHGKEQVAYADAGYAGAQNRVPRPGLRWEIAARRGSRPCPRAAPGMHWRRPSGARPAFAPGSSIPSGSSSGSSAT